MTAEPIRTLIADDHPVFRDGLRLLLDVTDGIEVVGQAASGQEAIDAVAALRPDIVVMDLQMPGMDGVEATRRILRTGPDIGVLVLTMFDDDESVFAAMRAGARGYLLKSASKREILVAVQAVASGEAIFGPSVAQRIVEYFTAPRRADHPDLFPELTAREAEVLDLIARGVNNAEITRRLVLSPKTVRNHVSNIFAKLQVADRAEAIVRARTAGLGQ